MLMSRILKYTLDWLSSTKLVEHKNLLSNQGSADIGVANENTRWGQGSVRLCIVKTNNQIANPEIIIKSLRMRSNLHDLIVLQLELCVKLRMSIQNRVKSKQQLVKVFVCRYSACEKIHTC